MSSYKSRSNIWKVQKVNDTGFTNRNSKIFKYFFQKRRIIYCNDSGEIVDGREKPNIDILKY